MVRHRCSSSAWTVLVLEIRSISPALLRAALLGETASTSGMTHCMGLFQMDAAGGAGEVSLPLLSSNGLVGSLRMHVHVPSQGVGTCRLQIHEAETDLEGLTGMIITVRALAFERPGDARVYLEAFQILGYGPVTNSTYHRQNHYLQLDFLGLDIPLSSTCFSA